VADLLTGDGGGERVPQDLEQANAFVVSLNAQRSWFITRWSTAYCSCAGPRRKTSSRCTRWPLLARLPAEASAEDAELAVLAAGDELVDRARALGLLAPAAHRSQAAVSPAPDAGETAVGPLVPALGVVEGDEAVVVGVVAVELPLDQERGLLP